MNVRLKGLLISCLGVLITLFWVIYRYKIDVEDAVHEFMHDMHTRTTSDFTVEFKIGSALWAKWRFKQEFLGNSSSNQVASLRLAT